MKKKTFTKIKVIIFSFSMLIAFNVNSQTSDEVKKQNNIAKQRQQFEQNKTSAINEMYKAYPQSKGLMAKSYAYAAFANTGVNLFVLASGNGGGKAHNNKTAAEVYVKMISVGAGVGIGFKKYYAVFLFADKAAYDNFLDKGWSADGQADATADTGKDGEGGSAAVGMNVSRGVTLFQIADKGLAVQATVQGVKYLVSDELNGKK
jgi:lipid-binding SYLF domain-containing protein